LSYVIVSYFLYSQLIWWGTKQQFLKLEFPFLKSAYPDLTHLPSAVTWVSNNITSGRSPSTSWHFHIIVTIFQTHREGRLRSG